MFAVVIMKTLSVPGRPGGVCLQVPIGIYHQFYNQVTIVMSDITSYVGLAIQLSVVTYTTVCEP